MPLPDLAAAFVLGLPTAFVLIPLSDRLGLLDKPGPIKPHARPIPYTGGAMIAGVILAIGVAVSLPVAVILGATAIWLVGFIDDTRGLAPLVKLAAEIPPLFAGSLAVDLSPIERVVAVLAGVVLVNVFNVTDGLDGLAGGTAAIILIALLVLGGPLSGVAAVALGAVAAFLLFNLPPARLFLGDEGSLLLGYVLWLVPLAALTVAPSAGLLAALLLAWAFPLTNTAFVVGARLRASRPVLTGDRSHLYDVLNRRFGLRGSLLVCWGLSAVGGVLAAAIA
jgi:UDP-GlcNAc:undecaprenyl-phosphate/decaprenyl-phosphate GlcNAc-1-phosphate transferase